MKKVEIAPLVLKPDPLIEVTGQWSPERFDSEVAELLAFYEESFSTGNFVDDEKARTQHPHEAHSLLSTIQRLSAIGAERRRQFQAEESAGTI